MLSRKVRLIIYEWEGSRVLAGLEPFSIVPNSTDGTTHRTMQLVLDDTVVVSPEGVN
jgi:hypothetical protein